jgi:hypothetical protein
MHDMKARFIAFTIRQRKWQRLRRTPDGKEKEFEVQLMELGEDPATLCVC